MGDVRPADLGLSDKFMEEALLPELAILHGVHDLLLPARLASLISTESQARKPTSDRARDRDAFDAAFIELCWEALAAMELAAHLARMLTHPRDVPTGRWMQMTNYRPGEAHQFYEAAHNWPEERYLVLAGTMVMADAGYVSVLDEVFDYDRPLKEALREAGAATAAHMRSVLRELARAWKRFRQFGLAAEHGFLHVPSRQGLITNENDEPLDYRAIVLDTRQDRPIAMPSEILAAAAGDAAQCASLAIEFARHVTDIRLTLSDAIEFSSGAAKLRTSFKLRPIYWFPTGAVTEEVLNILQSEIDISVISGAESSPFATAADNVLRRASRAAADPGRRGKLHANRGATAD